MHTANQLVDYCSSNSLASSACQSDLSVVQGMNAHVGEQKLLFSRLLCDIMQSITTVEGPMTAQDHAHLLQPMPEEQAGSLSGSEFFWENLYHITRVKTEQMELD
jgi:hypothetical protein